MRRPTRQRRAALSAAAVLSLAIAPIAAAGPAEAHSGGDNGRVSVGYMTQWGVYSGFYTKNLVTSGAVNKLTEIDYAFSNIAPDGTCASADAWADWQKPIDGANSVDGTS